MTGKQVAEKFRDKGWTHDRTEGSHYIYVKGEKTVSIPIHGSKDLKKGTLHSLLKKLSES